MDYQSKLKEIKAFAFDVDGVLTDGRVLVAESGDLLRMYNAKDGHALRMATTQGYKVAIITGGVSPTIPKRFNPMGISDIYLASFDKIHDFEDFCKKHELQAEEVLFMGDDIPDIEIMQHCGLACCPSDAVPEVKAAAHYISSQVGGDGCARDVISQVMKVQGRWTEN
ncbi:MAG: HAD-IIIA family hydrolase [Bacteroidales bacterium]|nr:HAD-IIIA family hydrolase [Bacteroidales bacterium]MCL2133690.1 HAD-IIIA family hydrolase [Bacteroidales bacterium]